MKLTATLAILLFAVSLLASDSPDLQMQTRIRQEVFWNSKVLDTAHTNFDSLERLQKDDLVAAKR